MRIDQPQMSCQACGNTQQLDVHFFWEAAQATPPAKDHSWPGAYTKVTALSEISDGKTLDSKRWVNRLMLVAYEDRGLQIKEIPSSEIKIFRHPIASHAEAIQILDEAAKLRPDVHWVIVGLGPWGVRGEL
jgi:hypothetical protein